MSDGNGKSKGEQAYRIVTAAGLGVICFLSVRVIADIDRMAAKIDAMQVQIAALNGRLDTHAHRLATIDRRSDLQDGRIDALQLRVYRLPEVARP
jgi:hypothetical protein